tara:strand:- start:112 stop:225 length:114 start_codon:yes stop_codon:yes gene_type:complete
MLMNEGERCVDEGERCVEREVIIVIHALSVNAEDQKS